MTASYMEQEDTCYQAGSRMTLHYAQWRMAYAGWYHAKTVVVWLHVIKVSMKEIIGA